MAALNLKQISTRLRSMRWQIPGEPVPVNLWGAKGKQLISVKMMTKLINQAIDEWATELMIDKEEWILDDGSGGEGTLTVDQRRYTLPSDALVITEARVAYNDSTGFWGYPLIIISEPFLDSSLTAYGNALATGSSPREWTYRNYNVLASEESDLVGSGLTITYASLGADVHGNTPPDTFTTTPVFTSIEADADRQVWIESNDETSFTVKAGAGGDDPPFNITFSFTEIGGVSSQSLEPQADLPERMFVWKNEFWLDPIPDDTYTLRMFGYHQPNSLSSDTDTPDPLDIYHESIFLKAKEMIARELGVPNEGQILGQYQRVAQQAKRLDDERHRSTGFIDPKSGGYW